MDSKPKLDSEIIQAFVGKAHGDFDYVKDTLTAHPEIVNAAWDWGGGDWESALGAAAHMGRRDIAELLLDHGARIDLFAAAMLGSLEIVQAVIARFPNAISTPGPHGIPLIKHAEAGGPQAVEVLNWLKLQIA